MAKPSTVARPTEAAALGRCKPGPLAAPAVLWPALARTVRLRDRRGAALIRFLLVRTMAGGEVGQR